MLYKKHSKTPHATFVVRDRVTVYNQRLSTVLIHDIVNLC